MDLWFSENIARCEAERDKHSGHERDLWNKALRVYRHLQMCKLHHQPRFGDNNLCKLEIISKDE
jgi:hypothetical protein